MARFAVFLALVAAVAAAPAMQKRSSGQATYFDTSVGEGACGHQNSNSDHIVAVNSAQYGGGSHCGQTVHIKNTSNGKTVTAKVADECPTCGYGDLDLTPSTFSAIANKEDGVAPISWSFSS